jgi:hypothetical protein
MDPETALMKADEILPGHIEHLPKGSISVVTPSEVVSPKRRKVKDKRKRIAPLLPPGEKHILVESEAQKRAFEFYLALGDKRSVRVVAEHFTIKYPLVNKWCNQFRWTDRVKILANQPDLDVAKANLAKYYRMKTGQMIVPDPEKTGKLMPNPEFKVSAAKEITAAVVALDKNVMDKEAHQKELEQGVGSGMGGKNRSGVMVNVIIQK